MIVHVTWMAEPLRSLMGACRLARMSGPARRCWRRAEASSAAGRGPDSYDVLGGIMTGLSLGLVSVILASLLEGGASPGRLTATTLVGCGLFSLLAAITSTILMWTDWADLGGHQETVRCGDHRRWQAAVTRMTNGRTAR